MKLNYLNFLSLASVAILNVKKAFAIDEFLANTTRPEFFELTDFNIPKVTINLPFDEYERFVLGHECFRDCSNEFLKRNEECYTASWVDLNVALKTSFDKKYLDYDAVKKNSDDYTLVENVITNNTHNITLNEFENLVLTYSNFTLEKIMVFNYGLYRLPDINIDSKNASMTVEIDGNVETIDKVKISVGGRSTRNYSKLGYNVNIKGENDFHGVKQFRFRSEVVDPSFIRDKLGYDLYNIIGLPTLSANYAQLYFNDRYMGFFLVRDAFKSHWVEETFGEKNTTHLYTCDGSYGNNVYFNCRNDDHEDDANYVDKDWNDFIKKLENTTTRDELKKFFDVDTYMRWQVSRYIFGSWDHVSRTHNNVVYMYHSEEKDLWIPLLYDFDLNFGSRNIINATRTFNEEVVNKETVNPLYKILNIDENSQEVRDIMQDIINKAFNPRTILSRIDQIRSFIAPYVLEDRTPDEKGRLPGRMDRSYINAEDLWDYDAFLENSEFTSMVTEYNNNGSKSIGFIYGALKAWIIDRFRVACSYYNLDCSFAQEYLDSPYFNTKDKIKEKVYSLTLGGCKGSGYACCALDDTPVSLKDSTGYWGVEAGQWCLFKNGVAENHDDMDYEKCWAKNAGYKCCEDPTTEINYTDDKNLFWGIENDKWCGITGRQCPEAGSYKCCKTCKVYYSDKKSDWGVEDGKWCSIPYTCRTRDI